MSDRELYAKHGGVGLLAPEFRSGPAAELAAQLDFDRAVLLNFALGEAHSDGYTKGLCARRSASERRRNAIAYCVVGAALVAVVGIVAALLTLCGPDVRLAIGGATGAVACLGLLHATQ